MFASLVVLAAAQAAAGPASLAQHQGQCAGKDGWSDPAPPLKIFGNVYNVGTCGITVVLITGPQGHVLIDSATAEAAPGIARNIARLGFRLRDVQVLLASHEHLDHVGGTAELQRRSGARLMVMPAAVPTMQSGEVQSDDPQANLHPKFPPARVDSVLRDGQIVSVGPIRLTAHATFGHAPGSTSWSWRSCEKSVCRNLVYADSVSAVSNDHYEFSEHPDYVRRFRASLKTIGALRCDLLITPHPSASNLYERLAGRAPLVNPKACSDYAAAAGKRLDERLAKEAR
jgi:metallo-beta-lactamase class B